MWFLTCRLKRLLDHPMSIHDSCAPPRVPGRQAGGHRGGRVHRLRRHPRVFQHFQDAVFAFQQLILRFVRFSRIPLFTCSQFVAFACAPGRVGRRECRGFRGCGFRLSTNHFDIIREVHAFRRRVIPHTCSRCSLFLRIGAL